MIYVVLSFKESKVEKEPRVSESKRKRKTTEFQSDLLDNFNYRQSIELRIHF